MRVLNNYALHYIDNVAYKYKLPVFIQFTILFLECLETI